MTSNREGDFDSILNDDSLDDPLDSAAQNLEALEALSENTEFLNEDSEGGTEESRIKVLIDKGKEQGYLTYVQLTESLPKNVTESDEFENVVQMFEEMGIGVYDQPPPISDLKDTGAEEISAENAVIASAESVVGKTIDPVRMYMREMGTVPLLTREGEIVIAKRIEDGIRETMAILSRYPGIIERIVSQYEAVCLEEGELTVIICGFLDIEDVIPDMSEVAKAKVFRQLPGR